MDERVGEACGGLTENRLNRQSIEFANAVRTVVYGTCRTYPEGMKGLSLGFQPQVYVNIEARPEGAADKFVPGSRSALVDNIHVCRPFEADRFFFANQGLKPLAESCHPFGISPTVRFYVIPTD